MILVDPSRAPNTRTAATTRPAYADQQEYNQGHPHFSVSNPEQGGQIRLVRLPANFIP
jgi:hypothetical protein